ncbi:hypothetical protein JCM10908_002852 [Rhodotorula pacifica]|uniref:uncharacterized protein n=1 Tax=Rhodotorula pacifica TaxID=1495444 RepID=UPI00317E42E4
MLLGSAGLALLTLETLVTAQLLFPANVHQYTFSAPSGNHSHASTAGPRWSDPSRTPRIAIIGAGAGGSSAAFFLKHFNDLAGEGLHTDVTVYDAADYVGGRSTVIWPWNDHPLVDPRGRWHPKTDTGGGEPYVDALEPPVELGASIYVSANKNLQKARKVFGLEEDAYGGEDGDMAIWDGEIFVFQESGGASWDWWNKAKLLWRYGRSAFTVRTLVQKTVASFVNVYSPAFVSQGAFPTVANFSAATNLQDAASLTASAFFSREGVSDLFTNELTSAATQVNYGTPVSRLHGVGALVSLAATGAVSVRGGNRQIFEQFVGRSGARLRLGENARIEELLKLDAGVRRRAKGTEGGETTGKATGRSSRAQWVVKTASGIGGGTYDAVILAAPYHQTGIHIVNSPTPALITKQPYVRLYVTFVITNATTPQASYFGLKEGTPMPNEIFGTFTTSSTRKPTFNSLNYLKPLPPAIGSRFDGGEGGTNATWHVVKMFSDHSLLPTDTGSSNNKSSNLLEDLFGRYNVAKTAEKTWLAYPKLAPVTRPEEDYAPVRPDEGLYYVNAMERLISTMETETVSAFNVVSLLLDDFYGYTPPASWAEWPEDQH